VLDNVVRSLEPGAGDDRDPSLKGVTTMSHDTDDRACAPVSRRALLGAGAATGVGALLGPAVSAGAARSHPRPRRSEVEVFSDPTINLQVLFALGAAAYGASEVGEVFTAIDQIRSRGSSDRAVFEVFLDWGRRTRERAEHAARHGRRVTARDCYLRAAMYLDQALFFTLASTTPTRSHEGRVYREMNACFTAAAGLMTPSFTKVAIPYRGRRLPGWLLTPAGPAVRRPTVILNNGSDGQNIDSYVYGGAAALDRGWNALIFEGPGQGSNLFLHNIIFPLRWEQVITPVVSWLRARPEVDPARIVLLSQSFGGFLVTRAAAFEHRLAAVVADPGIHDVFTGWTIGKGGLPPDLVALLRAGREREFTDYWRRALPHLSASERFVVAKRSEIYGNRGMYARLRHALQFRIGPPLAGRITAPTALTEPALESSFPGQARTVYGWLRAEPRKVIDFTVAQGAQLHCEPMAPTIRNDTVFDWVEANLRPVK
jgi:hypothetical protein